MFFWGVLVGLIGAVLIGWYGSKKQRDHVSAMERALSGESRRVTALERELATAKAEGAEAVRNEKLRQAREFGQYKILLRRADTALAQAKAARDDSILDAA
jgi:hypothetical protein